ncbi:MAG: DegT/DnrJ/EryC1/StrS family aminotransferase [Planctomycetota bacterium]
MKQSSEIPLSSPDITEAEVRAVTEVLRGGRLSIGPKQEEFEQRLAAVCGRRHGVAVSSGTAGLHAVLLASGVGPGDEVITTPFSFIASANCILMAGATPVFVDICPKSLNLDPKRVESAITEKTKAIVAVEVFGNPAWMSDLEAVARKHELLFIEDCCEGLGGKHHGRPIGSFGRAGVFGFYPNKQITTGEGGMIVTDDDRLAEMCRSLRNQGRGSAQFDTGAGGTVSNAGTWLSHQRLGYNYRLSEIAAALGVAQLDRLDAMLERRRQVAGWYMHCLMDLPDVVLPNVPDGCEQDMSWFVFVVRLGPSYDSESRDRVIAGLRRHEIGASNYFPCIHLQPFYRKAFGYTEGMFPIAESVSGRTVALPFFNGLDRPSVELVCQTLRHMLDRESLTRA